MDASIAAQIKAALTYLPFHLAASYAKAPITPEVKQSCRKAGGFIKGVCHCEEEYARIGAAGLQWERTDLPFPFDREGRLTEAYRKKKEELRQHRAAGVRVFAVTPYPRDYIAAGMDPRLPEDEARIREVAAFLIADMKGIAEAIQVTNGMGLPHFTQPLTMEEAARFIGMHLAAMHPHRGNILIGYNSAGPQADLHAAMRPWHKFCDYVGIDIDRDGCFNHFNRMRLFEPLCRSLWSMTGKPILLCSFGYISGSTPQTPEGQADFYRDMIPRLAKLPFLIGAVVHCWKDSPACHPCGQSDCPAEPHWGLVDQQGNEKPAFYAVRNAFSTL